jgi:D-alanyl-D-alanine endopeptidase (penicillin-binding protein 7)
VIDVATGRVLFEKGANIPHPIASLTKLVTAMTLLDDRPDMNVSVTILPEDDPHEGKTVLPIGGKFTRQELFHALLIGSVNIAGNALARSSEGGKTAFVERMNAKAKDLHLLQAKFVDPTGLEPENQASARDVATILRTALSYSEIRETTERSALTLTNRLTGKPIEISSTNLLLSSFLNKNPYRIVAAKTGSLPEAGFCLAQATRKEGAGEVISVVLGSENHFARFQDAKALTFWAFDSFTWPTPPSARLSN